MGFMDACQRFTTNLQSSGSYAANGLTSIPLKNLGYLSAVRLIFTISYTVTVGSGSAVYQNTRGKVTGNPTPFDLISKVQLFNNQNNALVDVSGWGLFQHNNTQRSGWNQTYQTNQTSVIDSNPFFNFQSGAITTGTITLPLIVPVAYKKDLSAGLLFMQNQQNSMRVDITWGPGTFITLAGGATAVVNSITVDAIQEYFAVDDMPENQPNTAFTYRVIEKTQDITGTGDTTMKPDLVQNRTMVRAVTEFVNNGAGMTASDISNVRWAVSGNDSIVNNSFNQQVLYGQEFLGRPTPRGVLLWNFDGGMGLPEIASDRDMINLAQVTEFALITTVNSSVSLTNAFQRHIYEYLEL